MRGFRRAGPDFCHIFYFPHAWPYFVTPAKVVRAARGSTFPSYGLPPREERKAPHSAASSVAGRACKAQRAERATRTGHDVRPGRNVRPTS